VVLFIVLTFCTGSAVIGTLARSDQKSTELVMTKKLVAEEIFLQKAGNSSGVVLFFDEKPTRPYLVIKGRDGEGKLSLGIDRAGNPFVQHSDAKGVPRIIMALEPTENLDVAG
jgi:hypothetical protein